MRPAFFTRENPVFAHIPVITVGSFNEARVLHAGKLAASFIQSSTLQLQ